MTTEHIRQAVLGLVGKYHISKVILFGSRADGNHREDSDVDLIMEFSTPVSLLTLSMIKLKLEEILHVGVDVIHGPIKETDLIEIGKVVELYAA